MTPRLQNESGLVLVTVLAVSIVLMIFTIGILSTNINQVTLGQKAINRIKAEQYAKGNFWLNYMRFMNGDTPAAPSNVTLDNRTYSHTTAASGAGINDTAQYDVSISY